MEIKNNISILDGTLRLFVGIIIATIGGVFSSILGVLAVIPIVSSLAGFCPVYSIMGISTATNTKDFSSH